MSHNENVIKSKFNIFLIDYRTAIRVISLFMYFYDKQHYMIYIMIKHLIHTNSDLAPIYRETQWMPFRNMRVLWLSSGKIRKGVFWPCVLSYWSFLLVQMTPKVIYAFTSGHNLVIGQKWSHRRSVHSPFCHSV